MPEVQDWFLTAAERGNPATDIDRRREDGRAWTEGNRVEALVHGATYYPRLLAALRALRHGDLVGITDWRGDTDERLEGEGTELGKVLAELAGRGVQVRGLLWRSHPSHEYSEAEAIQLGHLVNDAGGEILLD
ncbi:MAG TPA: phospholipase, partial [Actinomycetota bacterium]|nr:phospholipase [Actinomycetota bacterium]